MNQTTEKVREKLDKEIKLGKFDRYADAMKDYVQKVLLELCEQSEHFAQAVLDGDTFEDCMKAVAKSCGSAISDLDVCKRAVKFYCKGAEISFQMVLKEQSVLPLGASRRSPSEKGIEVIDLTAFF